MKEFDPHLLGRALDRLTEGEPPPEEEAESWIRSDPATVPLRSAGLEPDVAERLRLFEQTADLCPSVAVEATGYAVEARITPVELWRFYLPLCRLLRQLSGGTDGRLLAGVTGPGASGKSVFAALLVLLFNRVADPGRGTAAVCPLDGFHYPNAYLESHYLESGSEFGAGPGRVRLRKLKGAPPTFDAEAFVRTLRRLRSEPSVSFPRYDRRLHDPVPDGLRIGPQQRVVIVEGNYLLLEWGAWAEVRGLLETCWFISRSARGVREAIIRRHIRGGRSPESAREHYERVDSRNYRVITATRERADLLIRRDQSDRVVGVRTPGQAG